MEYWIDFNRHFIEHSLSLGNVIHVEIIIFIELNTDFFVFVYLLCIKILNEIHRIRIGWLVWAGLQSILYNESQSARGIVGLANGWQQWIDNNIGIDAIGYLHCASASIHLNGCRSNVQSSQSENTARFVYSK